MKTILTLIGLFVASACFAQQPPIPNCITNITVTITDTNAYLNGGSTTTQVGLGGTVTIDYAGCPQTDTIIGFVTWQCDQSVNCGGGLCPAGSGFTITMPKGCYEFNMRLYSFWGCCSLTHDDTGMGEHMCNLNNGGGGCQ